MIFGWAKVRFMRSQCNYSWLNPADFNNNRVLDFANLDHWQKNDLDKRKFGRMPWHDVSIGIAGPAVMSISDHFVGVKLTLVCKFNILTGQRGGIL